jgi:RNA polymerase primary sigma factor
MRKGRGDEPLATYLREINEVPLLNREQEQDLARRIQDGDMEARDLLIRSNLRLVVNIARNYYGRGIAMADLIEDGNLGLIRAAEGYDISYGTRFSTYASFWIKQSIKRAMANTCRTIRLPAYLVELLTKWNKAKNALTIPGQPKPTEAQIAKKAGITKKQQRLLKKAQHLQQVTTTPNQQEDGGDILDMVAIDQTERLYSADEIEILLKFVGKLPPQEADIIRMRFGMDCDELTLKEIGEIMGVTRQRIRQIEAKAIVRLKEWLARTSTF